ncbi:unnamed protein product [Ilex paraguariensis]|uniref:Uncharacterized protein n=1 Tax=Ilex paraguariensis TaxID=185542 RepID=A0ABC8V1Q8_9AQUA
MAFHSSPKDSKLAAAQYNHPPEYPVREVCGGIDGAYEGSDILGRIIAGVVGYKGNPSCYDTNQYIHPSETSVGWRWPLKVTILVFRLAVKWCYPSAVVEKTLCSPQHLIVSRIMLSIAKACMAFGLGPIGSQRIMEVMYVFIIYLLKNFEEFI